MKLYFEDVAFDGQLERTVAGADTGMANVGEWEHATTRTTTALVVEAVAPPEGGPSLEPGSNGPLRIMADLGSGRRLYDGKIRMTEAHWLVPGMDVEVIHDPSHPDRFEIDWESLPSMERRAAANDPALADPVAARRKVAHALRECRPPRPGHDSSTGCTTGRTLRKSVAVTRCEVARMSGARTTRRVLISRDSSSGRNPSNLVHSPTYGACGACRCIATKCSIASIAAIVARLSSSWRGAPRRVVCPGGQRARTG